MMKLIYTPLLALLISGCVEMGAKCAYMHCGVSAYSTEKGKYIEDTIIYREERLKERETRWVDNRIDFYLYQSKFGIFYDSSPVSGTQYKFDCSCSSYY